MPVETPLSLPTEPSLQLGPSHYTRFGLLVRSVGLMIESKGPEAQLGDICLIEQHGSRARAMKAEVVGFREGHLLLMPLGEMNALAPGARVWNTHRPFEINVGPHLLGHVLNGLGEPMDPDHCFPPGEAQYLANATPPNPLLRQAITTPLSMGIRALDSLLTLGYGQRVGVFAGSGVGKSTTLGMMARNTEADLNVIALIGERGREVKEFMDHALGPEGLKRSIVVVATAEAPALVKIKAGLTATAIAEYFRDKGKNVLLMMDSVTRIAMALREVGLATGEPPATRGYPPSVYAFMPKLLERTGMGATGSITGIYTVLVEGDDFNEPIADLTRGLLDGHIVLARELAQRNHYPAMDIGASISRLFPQLASPEHQALANEARRMLSTYRQNEDLLSVGAYVPGQNPVLDKAVKLHEPLNDFLRQSMDSNVSMEDSLAQLAQLLM
jgi:flagellum-specific ATP synthase